MNNKHFKFQTYILVPLTIEIAILSGTFNRKITQRYEDTFLPRFSFGHRPNITVDSFISPNVSEIYIAFPIDSTGLRIYCRSFFGVIYRNEISR
jgi:6,7-dimethyl-8-ribityllumazine synthase